MGQLNKKQNPDEKENTRMLARMFPGLYPCARCVKRDGCSRYLRCSKWQVFFYEAWEECRRTLKGE